MKKWKYRIWKKDQLTAVYVWLTYVVFVFGVVVSLLFGLTKCNEVTQTKYNKHTSPTTYQICKENILCLTTRINIDNPKGIAYMYTCTFVVQRVIIVNKLNAFVVHTFESYFFLLIVSSHRLIRNMEVKIRQTIVLPV